MVATGPAKDGTTVHHSSIEATCSGVATSRTSTFAKPAAVEPVQVRRRRTGQTAPACPEVESAHRVGADRVEQRAQPRICGGRPPHRKHRATAGPEHAQSLLGCRRRVSHQHQRLAAQDLVEGRIGHIDVLHIQLAHDHIAQAVTPCPLLCDRRHLGDHIRQYDMSFGSDDSSGVYTDTAWAAAEFEHIVTESQIGDSAAVPDGAAVDQSKGRMAARRGCLPRRSGGRCGR